MLKQHIQWEGFDGKPMNRTLFFNLTRFEVAHDMELEALEARFKAFQENVIGENPDPERKMTPPEIREMLDIVKILVKHAYGIQEHGPDGLEFRKSNEIWDRFVATGAFDAFIWYLFEDPNRANKFMEGIWPKEMQEAAAKIRAERPDIHPVPDVETEGFPPGKILSEPPVYPGDDGIPSIEGPVATVTTLPEKPEKKQWDDYSEDELLQMDRNQFETLFAEGRQGNNVPKMLLNIRQKRKLAEGAEDSPGGTTE